MTKIVKSRTAPNADFQHLLGHLLVRWHKQVNRVPPPGDLPFAGALFRFKGEQRVNSELMGFVTPWMVEQPALSERGSQVYEETEFEGPPPVHTDAEAAQDRFF
jgi:type II secretory pathway component GspD/PulD (secretin)